MILISGEYTPESEHRVKELAYVRAQNLSLDFVRAVIMLPYGLIEMGVDTQSGVRQTFQDALDLAARTARADEVVVVHNADIYFDESLRLAEWMGQGDFWALSRHEHSSRLGLKSARLAAGADHSQDAWVFKWPASHIWRDFCDMSRLEFGRVGMDNLIAYEAVLAGYRVINPSLSVLAWHVHDDHAAHGEEGRLRGVYYLPKPVMIGDGPQMVGEITDKYAHC
jgi:hypothetical protein